MANRPKIQGTAFETWMVKWLEKVTSIWGAERVAEGGSKDIGDVRWHTDEDVWVAECKATQTLNVTRVLSKARLKSPHPKTTVLLWKRLTRTKGNTKRTPDGEPIVVVMALDTFHLLMKNQ